MPTQGKEQKRGNKKKKTSWYTEGETKWEREGSALVSTAHNHVRLYSGTMKRALRAASASVTFSPSPWF